MTPTDVQNAKNKDLPASLIAIQRYGSENGATNRYGNRGP